MGHTLDGPLRGADLSRGPDLLRPGSRTCRGPVQPRYAFVYTRHAGSGGDRLVLRPATVGHEHILPEPDVLPALFGPDHRAVTAPARYARTVYNDRDPATGVFPAVGSVEDYDTFELRRLALGENMLGRYGHYKGVPLLMLWNQPPGWEDMLVAVIDKLGVPDGGVVTVGSAVLGTVADLRASQRRDVPGHGGEGMAETTWLASLEARGFDGGTRRMLVAEAQRTLFPRHLPAGFEFLGGGFVDLGFDRLGLEAADLDAVRLAFVGVGVTVPGTPWRLRFARPVQSVVEPADGREAVTLPGHWREGVVVAGRVGTPAGGETRGSGG